LSIFSSAFYSGCQKNVPFVERFFLQPLIPPVRIAELIFEKRMNYPAASNGVSTGIFLSPQGAGNSPLVRQRRIKFLNNMIPVDKILFSYNMNQKARDLNK
jgi:hypothetical protein